MINVLGVDPGLTGALALLDDRGRFLTISDMPIMSRGVKSGKSQNCVNYKGLQLLIDAWRAEYGEIVAYVENIHAMPGQGVTSMFNMGDTFGAIKAILACEDIETYYITPQSWKKHFKLTSDKEQCRAYAIRTCPQAAQYLDRKKDHNRAEALLIARYGVKLYESQ